jgi:hypothetical protein
MVNASPLIEYIRKRLNLPDEASVIEANVIQRSGSHERFQLTVLMPVKEDDDG